MHVAPVRPRHGWYDLTVVSDHDAAYARRLAGHLENGRPSTSEPAIATD